MRSCSLLLLFALGLVGANNDVSGSTTATSGDATSSSRRLDTELIASYEPATIVTSHVRVLK